MSTIYWRLPWPRSCTGTTSERKFQLQLEVLCLRQMTAPPLATAVQAESSQSGQGEQNGASSGSSLKKRTIDWPQDFVPGQRWQDSSPHWMPLDNKLSLCCLKPKELEVAHKELSPFLCAVKFPVTVTLITRHVAYRYLMSLRRA